MYGMSQTYDVLGSLTSSSKSQDILLMIDLLCEGFRGCEGCGHVFPVVVPEIESGVGAICSFQLNSLSTISTY